MVVVGQHHLRVAGGAEVLSLETRLVHESIDRSIHHHLTRSLTRSLPSVPVPRCQFVTSSDPGVADRSLEDLDAVWDEQGPFEAILGFSQGAAFTTVYLAHRQQTYGEHGFDRAVTISGFLLNDTPGLITDKIDPESPFEDVPSLHWMGKFDVIITPEQSREVLPYYTDPVVAYDPDGDHSPPQAGSARFDDIVAFLRGEEVCLDDPFLRVGNRDCAYVATRPSLCSRSFEGTLVSEVCPDSCGVCGA